MCKYFIVKSWPQLPQSADMLGRYQGAPVREFASLTLEI